jgi:pimeloyl-ACP methyl ester carboxylesterase
MDNVSDFVHIQLSLMDHLDLRDVVLVGTSLGGWVAAELAAINQDRINRIVLVAPVGVKVGPRDKLDIPDIFAMSDEKLVQLLYHDPSQAQFDPASKTDEELGIMVRNKQTLALVTWEPYMHNPKLKHKLFRVTRPVLLVRGESDGVVSEAYAKAYAELLPSAKFVSMPQAGHLPYYEQPEAFARLVTEFAA